MGMREHCNGAPSHHEVGRNLPDVAPIYRCQLVYRQQRYVFRDFAQKFPAPVAPDIHDLRCDGTKRMPISTFSYEVQLATGLRERGRFATLLDFLHSPFRMTNTARRKSLLHHTTLCSHLAQSVVHHTGPLLSLITEQRDEQRTCITLW